MSLATVEDHSEIKKRFMNIDEKYCRKKNAPILQLSGQAKANQTIQLCSKGISREI